jgi:hypothetical protein
MPLPPGFTVVAADDALARLLGLDGHGFLLHLMRHAEPTSIPAGGWAVLASMDDIAAAAGIGREKCIRLMRELRQHGLLHTETGRRLGRGFGSTPSRHFLATDPSMVLPTPPPDGVRRSGYRSSEDPLSDHRRAESGTAQRHLVPVAAPYTVAETARVMSEVSEHSSRERPTPPSSVPVGTPSGAPGQLPPSVTAALRRCGWVGKPPSTDVPADVVIALADWVATRSGVGSPGAYLRTILETPGEAVALAASLNLVTALGSAAAHADQVARMPLEEYWQRCHADEDWQQMVETEASRRAQVAGIPVSMALRREVAHEHATGRAASG